MIVSIASGGIVVGWSGSLAGDLDFIVAVICSSRTWRSGSQGREGGCPIAKMQ